MPATLTSLLVLLAVFLPMRSTVLPLTAVDVEEARIGLGTSCIDHRGPVRPAGDLLRVGSADARAEAGRQMTYIVEVEDGLPVDRACFARVVEYTLAHPLGWTADGSFRFRRIDEGEPDLRVTLASPDTVDRLCLPLRTGGIYSCWNGGRAVLNYDRWVEGAPDFGDDLVTYRIYLINHEVGHGLGHGHVGCPAAGAPAPVMMQQTKSVGACVPNGWPGE